MTTNEAKFVCKRCGYDAPTKQCLKKHLERIVPCTVTKENISIINHLKELEKKYNWNAVSCKQCGKQFNTPSNVYHHKKACKGKPIVPSIVKQEIIELPTIELLAKKFADLEYSNKVMETKIKYMEREIASLNKALMDKRNIDAPIDAPIDTESVIQRFDITQCNNIIPFNIDHSLAIQNQNIEESAISDINITVTDSNSTNQVKGKKKKIPQSVRSHCWNEWIGLEKGSSKCLCCQRNIITLLNFHCGHVLAEKNGGTLMIDNLRPVCNACNQDMGSINMKEFAKEYYGIDM